MTPEAVIAIFDIGKTNKKLLIFSKSLQLLAESCQEIPEITDDDGFPCDDLMAIQRFIFEQLDQLLENPNWQLESINFSAYGASLVYLDENAQPLTPLYNYLKPYPDNLLQILMDQNGGAVRWSAETASPLLGSLNSGLQLYRIKQERPDLYNRVNFALHLPQYLSFLLTGLTCSDFTSIGCHTGLWDFRKSDYHEWVKREGLIEKLAPVFPADYKERIKYKGKSFWCGIGLHDSSAALIPYLKQNTEPFVLLSTGTWCIALNPFNTTPLTERELKTDCLAYLSYEGTPVKASRLFGGYEHAVQVAGIAKHFGVSEKDILQIQFDPSFIPAPSEFNFNQPPSSGAMIELLSYRQRKLEDFSNSSAAYHQLIFDLVALQSASIKLVVDSNIRQLYVDGGFIHNTIFIQYLKMAIPDMQIYLSDMPHASALGAAMALKQ